MNKISLTKVERKSIICSSLFYVLSIFIITDQMINGFYFIKLFPLLYFLGLLEKKFFNKIYMTITIVGFTTFVMSIIKMWEFNTNVIIITLTHICVLIFGIITGYIISEFKLNKRKVLELKLYKKIIYIISIILSLVFAIYLNVLLNGNIFNYFNSKKNLDTFLKNNYEISKVDYKIKDVKYNVWGSKRSYIYYVNILDNIYIFEEKANKIFEDLNYIKRLENLNYIKNIDFKKRIEKDVKIKELIDYNESHIKLEYKENLLRPEYAYINIVTKKNILTEDDVNNVKNLLYSLKDEKYLTNYELEFIIYFNQNVVKIKSDNILNFNLEFINKSIAVEVI